MKKIELHEHWTLRRLLTESGELTICLCICNRCGTHDYEDLTPIDDRECYLCAGTFYNAIEYIQNKQGSLSQIKEIDRLRIVEKIECRIPEFFDRSKEDMYSSQF